MSRAFSSPAQWVRSGWGCRSDKAAEADPAGATRLAGRALAEPGCEGTPAAPHHPQRNGLFPNLVKKGGKSAAGNSKCPSPQASARKDPWR